MRIEDGDLQYPQSSILTRFVTPELTIFGSESFVDFQDSLNHTTYGYLRGAESLARALPN
ncbi:MAG TPA: hypothetical protein VKF81_03855 [Blastocatellia bacterium]|nr:hypothetical protein [Blastocatellia bacterium]